MAHCNLSTIRDEEDKLFVKPADMSYSEWDARAKEFKYARITEYYQRLPPPMTWDEFPLDLILSLKEKARSSPTQLKDMPLFHYGVFLTKAEVVALGTFAFTYLNWDMLKEEERILEPNDKVDNITDVVNYVNAVIIEGYKVKGIRCRPGETVTPDIGSAICSFIHTLEVDKEWPSKEKVLLALDICQDALQELGLERETLSEARWYFDRDGFSPRRDTNDYRHYDAERVLGPELFTYFRKIKGHELDSIDSTTRHLATTSLQTE